MIVHHEICLAVAYLLLDHVVRQSLLIAPVCDELAVLHVGLGVFLAELHAVELCEDAVADIA